MPKGDSKKTIEKILQTSEELFSEHGFNATSISMISDRAGVSNALIYYHFKDKDDIIKSLFENLLAESDRYVEEASSFVPNENGVIGMIKEEISYMQNKDKILNIMLMESLKDNDKCGYFFDLAEKIIRNESEGKIDLDDDTVNPKDKQKYLVYEFFTGVIPLIMFTVFRDKWCKRFKCDPDEITDMFLEAFYETHLSRNH
jgi:Transcriptional regulator